jgi:hypothetical protein
MRSARACFICLAIATATNLPATSALATGQPPSVQLLVAPANGDTVYEAVNFSWLGTDPDGSVANYWYAIDPAAGGEPLWILTSRTQEILFFRCGHPIEPIPPNGPIVFAESHTVTVEAVDNEGLESPPLSRTFVTYTIAPEVHVTSPVPNPSPFFPTQIGTSATFSWEGHDWDAYFFNGQPFQYKWKILSLEDPQNLQFLSNPDLLRLQASGSLWAGWDSTYFDSPAVSFTNLTPGSRYLFCVVGFDEVGAYSARFALGVNVIWAEAVAGLDVATTDRDRKIELSPPSPNPARHLSRLAFKLPKEQPVGLVLHDMQGRRVRTLASGSATAGGHSITWDLRDSRGNPVAPGIYFVRLEAGGQVLTQKLLVVP